MIELQRANKILNKLHVFFNESTKKQRKHRAELKKNLKKLKDCERDLLVKSVIADNEGEKQQLTDEIKIVHARRLKGLKKLKELRAH